VTPDDLLQALRQGGDLQGPAEAYHLEKMIGMRADPELIDKPQAFLSIGKGQRARPGRGLQRRSRVPQVALAGCLNDPGYARHRRRLKEAAEGYLDMSGLAYTRNQLRRQYGVPPTGRSYH
jgi:hypothetical protein